MGPNRWSMSGEYRKEWKKSRIAVLDDTETHHLIIHEACTGATNGTRSVAVISIYAEEPPL
jgi:hypothetical protein